MDLVNSFIAFQKIHSNKNPQDGKQEGDADVDMKAEEASPRDGDVSPITQSVSNLPEEKPSTSRPKKTEPAFELRPNFSRVTPSQLAYISFPPDGRYQPVRAVSTKTPLSKAGKAVATSGLSSSALGLGSEKYAGGGGILLLTDLRPNEESEFIEIATAPPAVPAVAEVVVPTENGSAVGAPPTGRHIALDENGAESEPPEAFEACIKIFWHGSRLLTAFPVSFRQRYIDHDLYAISTDVFNDVFLIMFYSFYVTFKQIFSQVDWFIMQSTDSTVRSPVAILDDYRGVALSSVDWSHLRDRVETDVSETLSLMEVILFEDGKIQKILWNARANKITPPIFV